jgi:hypothetical protein
MSPSVRTVSIESQEEALATELAAVFAAYPIESARGKADQRPFIAAQKSGLSLLNDAELPLWDALVENSRECSVFLKSWWLKAACGEARVLGYFESGRLVAGIPLYYERRFGVRMCRMPKLTQTLGVVIQNLPGKKVAQESRETEILDCFAARLSEEPVFIQAFHPAQQNWLPFHWRGYTQTTHYTHVFDDLSSLNKIWDGLDRDRRNNIRKARRLNLSVRECGPETVHAAAKASFERQNRSCPYRADYLARLYEAARRNDAGICLAASDNQGRIHAAEFFVWDAQRGYRVAGGHDTALGHSGGAVLLVWTLIEFAATRTAVFDFEGSMHKPIEASYRSFGTRRVPYNRIVRMPRWLRIGLCSAGLPFV